MIDFKEFQEDINDGGRILEKALCLLTKSSQVVFIVDNCDERLMSYLGKVGIENCISLTCNSSQKTRERELEKWRAGECKFLFVKKLYRSCNTVRSYITQYAKSIIVTRNITVPNHIVSLLNEFDFSSNKTLDFIYLMKDFEFIYNYGSENSDESSIVITRSVRDKQICPLCSTEHKNLAKTCLHCGFDFPHQSYTNNTELRIGIIVDDFNPLSDSSINVDVFKNLEHMLELLNNGKNLTSALVKSDGKDGKKLTAALVKSDDKEKNDKEKNDEKSFKYSMIEETITNYEGGTLICFTCNHESKLTFLSIVPASICEDIAKAWENYFNNIFSSVPLAGVKELLSNLSLGVLKESSKSHGYQYDFNDVQREIIKKKFIENDLVAQTMAQQEYREKLNKKTSVVSYYAKQLHSLSKVVDKKTRSRVVQSMAYSYINSLGNKSKLLISKSE